MIIFAQGKRFKCLINYLKSKHDENDKKIRENKIND